MPSCESKAHPSQGPRWPHWLEWLGISIVSLGLCWLFFLGWKLNDSVDQATRLLSELEALERAGKAWAEAVGQPPGTWVSYSQVRPHIKPQSRQLVKRGGSDPLGHPWPPFQAGKGYFAQPAPESWEALTPAVGEAFWHPRLAPSEP